jgi:hypothetical protein
MKKKSSLVTAGLFILLAAGAVAERSATKSEPAAPIRETQSIPSTPSSPKTAVPAKGDTGKEKRSPVQSESTIPASSELAASEALKKANEEHIRESRTFLIVDTPPPPPRAEKKPPSPASDLVWVPGHWIPVKGEWQWRRGEWGFPATPVSVWIEARYDAKTKHWTAGYWQPDKPSPPEPASTQNDQPPAQKFF